jgi:DnaJ-class molecular chaperone
MKMKPCSHCHGTGISTIDWAEAPYNVLECPTCDGTGTIPDEPISHCQACGEPVDLGLKWCQLHQAATDL